jgi:nucleoid-associated protein YgaU
MMQKDFKIGLVFGAVCLLGLLVWLATSNSLSSNARLAKSFEESQTKTPPASGVNVLPVSDTQALLAETPPPNTSTLPGTPRKEPPETQPEPMQPAFVGRESNLYGPEDPATEHLGPKIKTNRFHIVGEGETLSGISQKHYGTAKLWPKILQANSDRLTAPEKIQPGMYLVIPD